MCVCAGAPGAYSTILTLLHEAANNRLPVELVLHAVVGCAIAQTLAIRNIYAHEPLAIYRMLACGKAVVAHASVRAPHQNTKHSTRYVTEIMGMFGGYVR